MKCLKECYFFKEKQWNVQKNAIYSIRNSEVFKRMLFVQGGTVKGLKEFYLFKEEQWNVQKNAIYSRKNSEMYKRMLFIRTSQNQQICGVI